MYKHPLYKAGAWCQDCWGPKKHCQNPEWKEEGKYCAYSNFCKMCLAFNPKQKKYKDLALSKHMCNYGTEEMPSEPHPFKRKLKDEQIIHPQDITESRSAEVASLHAKADESRKRSANLTQQKIAKRMKLIQEKAEAKAAAELKKKKGTKKSEKEDGEI